MMTITAETLRVWLEEGYLGTILDVRPTPEYAEWSIPASLHIDAYDALKAHDPEALSGVKLPTDQPIVTVCGAGAISRIAAEQLVERGFHALSLCLWPDLSTFPTATTPSGCQGIPCHVTDPLPDLE